jgi:hypothetical protein
MEIDKNARGFAMLLVYLPALIFETYLEMLNEPAFITQPQKALTSVRKPPDFRDESINAAGRS